MALVLKDRVRQTSTTAGTGTITLSGSVTGFQGFSVIGSGNTTYYTIADQSGANWEVGLGTYTSPNQLSRDTVYESSNSNNLVNFTSGTKDVFVTFPAEAVTTGGVTGSGTTNYLPKFASSTSVGDSNLLQGGTTILTKRNAAPSVFSTVNGTLSAAALCTGYYFLDGGLAGNNIYFPTGSDIDTALGLSGSTPTNVTFDCTFAWEYPNDSGTPVGFLENTGCIYPVGSTFEGGAYGLYDFYASAVTFRFYRTGAGSYTVYWGV